MNINKHNKSFAKIVANKHTLDNSRTILSVGINDSNFPFFYHCLNNEVDVISFLRKLADEIELQKLEINKL